MQIYYIDYLKRKLANVNNVELTVMASNSSDEVRSVSISELCEPCMCNSKKVTAVLFCLDCEEKFCEGCGNCHSTSKLSKDHRLSKVEEAPPSDVVQRMKKLIACPDHQSEEVVYICIDEDKLCCNQCAITQHRQCKRLYTIEQCIEWHVAPETATAPFQKISYYDNYSSPVYVQVQPELKHEEINACSKRIEDDLIMLENQLKRINKHEANLQEVVNKSPDQVREYLQGVHAKLESAFSTLERQLMDQCRAKVGELVLNSLETQLCVGPLVSQIKGYHENMSLIKKHGKDKHVFLHCRDMNKILKAVQDNVKNLEQTKSMSTVTVDEQLSTDQIVTSILTAVQINLTCFDMNEESASDG